MTRENVLLDHLLESSAWKNAKDFRVAVVGFTNLGKTYHRIFGNSHRAIEIWECVLVIAERKYGRDHYEIVALPISRKREARDGSV
jgi:hypothetical protein